MDSLRTDGAWSLGLEQYAACLSRVLHGCGTVRAPLPLVPAQLGLAMHPSVGALALLGELAASVQQRSSAAASEASPESRELANTLAALPASQRQPHVESLVLRAVRELTDDAEASVTASTPLMEAGIDSLAAMELSSRLRAATGLALSPTLVFEQPTPRAIAAHVLEQLAGVQEPAMVPAAAAGSARAAVGGLVYVRGAAGRWPGGCEGGAGA
eukprot:scaffold38505_cov69-Phaeocystis_antarctica.AAC.1